MAYSWNNETGIAIHYKFYIEVIHVDLGNSCRTELTVTFSDTAPGGQRCQLYTKTNCPKAFQWTPSQPTLLDYGHHVGIEYAEDGREHIVVAHLDILSSEMLNRLTYNRDGMARIEVKQTLPSGTNIVQLKVHRHQFYFNAELSASVALEFAQREDCLRFIQQDMSKLEYKDIVQDQKGGQFTVVDGIVDAIAPLVSECHRAQRHAVRRGISVSQFQEEYPQPETKWIRHQASTREQTRPCYLTLRLEVAFGFDATPQILRLDWTATSIAPAFPSRSMSFRSLNELHVKVPSPVPQDDDHDVSAPSHQSDLTVTISAHGISVVDGMSSVSAGNSFSINSVHRAVTINYINNIGDAFLGPITASNIGGTQNVNTICMDAVESSSPRVVQPLSRRRALPLPQEIARSMHKWSGSRFGG